MAKWIEFKQVAVKTKTKKFDIVNIHSGESIGVIKWFGRFRQYSFFPNQDTVYEHQCLKDIASFLDSLMLERKLNK